MSGKFSGFTEDDIKKVQNNSPPNKNEAETEKSVPRNKKTNKVVMRVDAARYKILESKIPKEENLPTPEGAKLSKPPTNNSEQSNTINSNNDKKPPENRETIKENKPENSIPSETDSSDINKRKIDLEEFEARQKAIEEQNNKRKEVIMKTLAARTKQTEEEARRLKEIQEEFKKLDATLSNDVKILRKKIELASIDYMEAHKQYLKVERIFLTAKLHLQKQLERKEMLTEHLCTIIEQNEERKAKKLTELIEKLNSEGNQSEQKSENNSV